MDFYSAILDDSTLESMVDTLVDRRIENMGEDEKDEILRLYAKIELSSTHTPEEDDLTIYEEDLVRNIEYGVNPEEFYTNHSVNNESVELLREFYGYEKD